MSTFLKILARSRLYIKPHLEYLNPTRNISCTQNALSNLKTGGDSARDQAARKKKITAKITLLAADNSMSITSLEEAQKLSKRRNLQLVKVQEMDTKTQRPVYQLVNAADFLKEESSPSHSNSSQSSSKRTEKLLTIGSRISDHDLASRLKNISKWLSKQNEVRVLLQGSPDDVQNCEKIFQKIEEAIKQPAVVGKVVQKRSKGGHIKFNILPVDPPADGDKP